MADLIDFASKKIGAVSTEREFRRLIGQIVDEDQRHQHIPDYLIEIQDGNMVIFRSRGTAGIVPAKFDERTGTGQLSAMTYESAKDAAPGWDIYYLEREWMDWMTEDGCLYRFCWSLLGSEHKRFLNTWINGCR